MDIYTLCFENVKELHSGILEMPELSPIGVSSHQSFGLKKWFQRQGKPIKMATFHFFPLNCLPESPESTDLESVI